MGKLTGKITHAVSHVYSDETVKNKAMNATHNGETMAEVWNKINSATNLRKETQDDGRVNYYMQNSKNGHWDNVGWSQTRGDGSFGMGWFDDKAYKKLEVPEPEFNPMTTIREYDESLSEDFDDYESDFE